MKRCVAILAMTLLAALTLPAQGRGRGHMGGGGMGPMGQMPATTPGTVHSNAPLRAPAASADRDTGRDRASDVGRGNKKGLTKKHKNRKKQRTRIEQEQDRSSKN